MIGDVKDPFLLQFHSFLAWFVCFACFLSGIWLISAHFIRTLRIRASWWLLVLSQLSLFVQVAIGVALVEAERKKPPTLHPFYGFFGIIVVGFLYAYLPRFIKNKYIYYGIGSIFLAGLTIRAIITANK